MTHAALTARVTHVTARARAGPPRTSRRQRLQRCAGRGTSTRQPAAGRSQRRGPCRTRGRSARRVTIALSPLAGAIAASVASSPSPQVTSGTPSGGGSSSNTALGLAALVAAAGARSSSARQLAAAAGIADIGTLTALGHSASIFWAGSCVSLGTGNTATAATVNASLAADRSRPRMRSGAARSSASGARSRVWAVGRRTRSAARGDHPRPGR